MKSSKAELHKALESIQGIPVLVVGDLILDRYIWGKVDRISPEAPVPIVEVKKEEDRLGGAGNVACNLSGIGAKVTICGLVGDDKEAQVVLKLLESQNIGREGVMVDRERPTCLKTRVIAHAQQVVRIDRESRALPSTVLREGFAAAVETQIESCKTIIVSDYGKGVVGDALMRKLAEASKSKKIGMGSRPWVVDPHPTNYGIYKDICIAKPNRKEAELASGVAITDQESATRAAQILLEKWNAEMILITLGEDGLLILPTKEQKPLFLDTVALEVFDVSGAGDTVTSIFSTALASGANAQVAGDLANIGAGIVVSEVGTVSVTKAQLQAEIERLAK